jgi:hypothetical protein
VAHLGAVPVFYPIDERGAPLLSWLNARDTSKVRAIFAVHFFGQPQPLQALRAWCDQRRITLVEDCAHALFGRSQGRTIGTWGDIAIGSLPKFLPALEGGCMLFNGSTPAPALEPRSAAQDAKAALHILQVGALHGRLFGLNQLLRGTAELTKRLRKALRGANRQEAAATAPSMPSLALIQEFGYELDVGLAHRRLSAPTRWVASRLPRERIVERRRQRYAELARLLSGHTGFRPLWPQLPPDCAPYVFPLWVDEPDPGYAALRRRMPVFRWDQLWPGMPILEGDAGVPWSRHVFQLACHQDLSDDEMHRYVQTLRELFDTGRR